MGQLHVTVPQGVLAVKKNLNKLRDNRAVSLGPEIRKPKLMPFPP
jgi:hypothetical protein